MATVSYTYKLKCNGGNVSQVKINGTDVKRVKINGVDVINKFSTYTVTVTLNCYIIFREIRKITEYTECGKIYTHYEYTGEIIVSYTLSGDVGNVDVVIPVVEFYFREYYICQNFYFSHKTLSNIEPSWEVENPIYHNPEGTNVYSFSGSFTKGKGDDYVLCEDRYLDGSEMRTSWGNVNISAAHYLSELGAVDIDTIINRDIKLGSISKTFTRNVQEY